MSRGGDGGGVSSRCRNMELFREVTTPPLPTPPWESIPTTVARMWRCHQLIFPVLTSISILDRNRPGMRPSCHRPGKRHLAAFARVPPSPPAPPPTTTAFIPPDTAHLLPPSINTTIPDKRDEGEEQSCGDGGVLVATAWTECTWLTFGGCNIYEA